MTQWHNIGFEHSLKYLVYQKSEIKQYYHFIERERSNSPCPKWC